MEVSGKPNEGLMALVPLTVFVLFVVIALGGPTSFANIVSDWAADVGHFFTRLIRSL